jgi:glycosyltransferase involved in cell wall biosynthesis
LAGIYTEGFNYQENYLSKYHAKKYETYLLTNRYMFHEGKIVKSSDCKYINKDGVQVYRLKEWFSAFSYNINFYIGYYKNLKKSIEQISPDIIFIHNVQFNNIRTVATYVERNPKTVVYVDSHSDFSNSGTNILSKLFLKTKWRKCAQIIEPYTKKFYGVLPVRVAFLTDIFHVPKEKCELLVMGADDDLVKKADKYTCKRIRKKYGINNDDFLIITGGKIDRFKIKTIDLLEAVQRINNPKVKLILFGSIDKSLKPQINSLINDCNIFYEPWLTSEQSYEYMSAANIAVFPGRHSVYWEQAAGQGIPLICKYWEGTTHVDCGGNVIFLKEGNTDEIQNVLEELLKHPLKYQHMKEVAVNSAAKVFSYKYIADRSIQE